MLKLLQWISTLLSLLFGTLWLWRYLLAYNEQGVYLNATEGAVYHEQAVLVYGLLAIVCLLFALWCKTMRRLDAGTHSSIKAEQQTKYEVLHGLEWPETMHGKERELFYESLLSLIPSSAKYMVIVLTPAPLGTARSAIEADCNGHLRAIEMPYDGVAWCCMRSQFPHVLPCLFEARRPELALLAFHVCPDASEVSTALHSKDAYPAASVLFFDEGDLVEIREKQNQEQNNDQNTKR